MNRVSSILGGLAVIAIAIVFIVQFRPATGTQATSGPVCAIEIRGNCMSSIEFWAAYRLLAPRNADAGRLKAMGLRRQAAEGLVDQWLLNEDAKRLGIAVSDEDLNAELAKGRVHISVAADKMRSLGYALGLSDDMVRYIGVKDRKSGKFDTKTYEKEVRFITKMSPNDFRDFQRRELIAARMRDLVRSRVRIGEKEAFDQFAYEKSNVQVSYVKLDRKFYADVALDTSQKAIDAWADKNKEEIDKVWDARKGQYAECRVARHILAKSDASDTDPDTAKAEAKKKIEAIVERLKKDDFATVAREESDDGSAAQGGDLGCLPKGRTVKPFEDALFALEEGKRSGIVETEFGFHVIELDKALKGDDAAKAGRAAVTKELYTSHEAERLAAEAAKEILGAAQGGKSLDDAVKTHLDAIRAKRSSGGDKKDKKDDKKKKGPSIDDHPLKPTVEATLPFSVADQDPIQGIKAGTSVAQIAFGLAKVGDLPPDVVPLDNGYAVIQLKAKTPASQEQWEKDRDFYMSAMRGAKQNDALVSYMKRLRLTLGNEVKLNQTLVNEPADKEGAEPEPEQEE